MDIEHLIKQRKAYIGNVLHMPDDMQLKAKKLCFAYNQTPPDAEEERLRILKELLGSCTDLTFIQPDFHCDYGFNIHFHGMAFLNYNCVILDTSPVDIGSNAFLAPGVCLTCAGHPIDPNQRAEGIETSAPIVLGDNVWLGANVTVCGGVTIGDNVVIGAGSVVTRDIPSNVVALGSPCRVLRPVTKKDLIAPDQVLF